MHARADDAGQRETVSREPEVRGPATGVARALELQRTIGNRATAQALQRFGIGDLIDIGTGGVGNAALRMAYEAAMAYGRANSTVVAIPSSYDADLDAYAAANPEDGRKIKRGRERGPTFRRGGLVPDGALAITFDRDIFCQPDEPSVDTYVHELVHVWQYEQAGGPIQFIENLIGGAAANILWKFARGEKVDIYHASAYEEQAYALEARFHAWRAARSSP